MDAKLSKQARRALRRAQHKQRLATKIAGRVAQEERAALQQKAKADQRQRQMDAWRKDHLHHNALAPLPSRDGRLNNGLKELGFNKNQLNEQLRDSLSGTYNYCQHYKLFAISQIRLYRKRYFSALELLRHGNRPRAVGLFNELSGLANSHARAIHLRQGYGGQENLERTASAGISQEHCQDGTKDGQAAQATAVREARDASGSALDPGPALHPASCSIGSCFR